MEENRKMMKKLISFVCCLLPFGAGAVSLSPLPGEQAVNTSQFPTDNSTITIVSGTGIDAYTYTDGFSIAGNMYVGATDDQGNTSGDLYVLSSAGNPFTIVSDGTVSISALLTVLEGRTLGFRANQGTFDLSFGSINNDGTIVMEDIAGFTSGAIVNNGDFSLDANTITAGAVNVDSGDTTLTASGDVSVGQLVSVTHGDVTVDASGNFVSSGAVSNAYGDMSISSGATAQITVDGNLSNSGNLMDVSGGNVTVTGTMKNDNADGTLKFNVASLSVVGGESGTYSFVNNGDFDAVVTGNTNFANGINLSAMGVDNTFRLDTGTFTINTNSASWFDAFSNHLNSFSVAIRQGDIDATTILNGGNSSGQLNAGANMSLLAQNVTASAVTNKGANLSVSATEDITITGVVNGNTGTTTLVAADTLDVQDAVSNMAQMILNANTVKLTSISNTGTGSDLTVSAPTDASASIAVSGNVTNSVGNTTIWAKDVNIVGNVTNSSGTTTIKGSDSAGDEMQIGSVNVAGGALNLNAFAQSAKVLNDLTVSGGALNLGSSLYNLVVGGDLQVAGDITMGDAITGDGDVNVAAVGNRVIINLDADTAQSTGSAHIDGNIIATDADNSRVLQLISDNITVGQTVDGDNVGGVTVSGQGQVVFGDVNTLSVGTSALDIADALNVQDGGVAEIFAESTGVGEMTIDGARVLAHGRYIIADTGDITIGGNVYFDGTTTGNGLFLDGTTFNLATTAAEADVNVGAVYVGTNKNLSVNSKDEIVVGGVLNNAGLTNLTADGVATVTGTVQNSGTLSVSGASISMQDITGLATTDNYTGVTLVANGGDVAVGTLTNSATFSVSGADEFSAKSITNTAGEMDITANSVVAQSLSVSGATDSKVTLNAASADFVGNVIVSGALNQGAGTDAMLNIGGMSSLSAANLNVGGDFTADSGNVKYSILNNVVIGGDVTVADGATSVINANAGTLTAADVTNAGNLTLFAAQGGALANVANNSGILTLDSGSGNFDVSQMLVNGGNVLLNGAGVSIDSAIDTGAMLYQNYTGALANKDINVLSDNYVVDATSLNLMGISQVSGALRVNTGDITVEKDIAATDLKFYAAPANNWMSVDVGGSVSGGVEFVGLDKMNIGANYTFDNSSKINAAILKYADGTGSSDINYWADVSLNNDDTLGQITNRENAQALIQVGGEFITNLTNLGSADTSTLDDAQIGIDIFDIIDQGSAIWFLHADEGIQELATKIRNLNVKFCNADGSLCYNYFDSLLKEGSNDSDDLPAYVSVRDSDDNGAADSLYIVFDPRFGGPVKVFDIQPIVNREPSHTTGEYVSAGAIDDLITGRLYAKKFYNDTPIEVIPLVFQGTNLSQMANELYNRMEYYSMSFEGEGLARFSRLFQAREIEQIMGSVVLNEHTSFRSFEDRMIDEFIWHRNRNLKKAWLDVDYGMFNQKVTDNKRADGNRFSVSGGFDWQKSNTLILGLTGRVSHMSGDNGDTMDLGYLPNQSIAGNVDITVSDTDIGLGGYLMKTLGDKTRLYGNAFVDLHVFDVTRNQNFVNTIDGGGTAFSLISEWGLMHDILNQYIVGNIYARAGYNFGFDVTEKVNGSDYMKMKSDGYMILTPGYSLTAQKRIYPSAWFQIRPYASIGIEYDVLGAPDNAKYKFAMANGFTKYDIDIDPMWANIGGGVELLSATGIQVGLDYRYQYNSDIQLHNIKLSGSYRF